MRKPFVVRNKTKSYDITEGILSIIERKKDDLPIIISRADVTQELMRHYIAAQTKAGYEPDYARIIEIDQVLRMRYYFNAGYKPLRGLGINYIPITTTLVEAVNTKGDDLLDVLNNTPRIEIKNYLPRRGETIGGIAIIEPGIAISISKQSLANKVNQIIGRMQEVLEEARNLSIDPMYRARVSMALPELQTKLKDIVQPKLRLITKRLEKPKETSSE